MYLWSFTKLRPLVSLFIPCGLLSLYFGHFEVWNFWYFLCSLPLKHFISSISSPLSCKCPNHQLFLSPDLSSPLASLSFIISTKSEHFLISAHLSIQKNKNTKHPWSVASPISSLSSSSHKYKCILHPLILLLSWPGFLLAGNLALYLGVKYLLLVIILFSLLESVANNLDPMHLISRGVLPHYLYLYVLDFFLWCINTLICSIQGRGESLFDACHCNTKPFFCSFLLNQISWKQNLYTVTSFPHKSLFIFQECVPVPKISTNFLWGLCASNPSQPTFFQYDHCTSRSI